jgi:hypothetical protein
MASTTNTTPRPRHLSLAQSAAFLPHVGAVIGTSGKAWAAAVTPLNLTPGQYVITEYVIGPGKDGKPTANTGKAAALLIPADKAAARAAVEAADKAAADWQDAAWLKAQRKAAAVKADKARAILAAVEAAGKPGKARADKGKGKPGKGKGKA